MKLKLSLRLEQFQKLVSPILGLSPLELELLLDQSLEQVKDFHEENPSWKGENPPENRGDYFMHGDFLDSCRSVRNKIARERHLEIPQILVGWSEEGYSTRYDPQIDERIKEKLTRFKRAGEVGTLPVDKIFSKRFAKEREWIVKQQLTIVKYLCETQDRYVKSKNPIDLEPVTQQNVAERIGYSDPTVCRMIQNLTLQLPDGRVLFAEELIPGAKTAIIKGKYALQRLQKDPDLYDHGKWKVSDSKLSPILKERFGIEAARRTISKYRGML